MHALFNTSKDPTPNPVPVPKRRLLTRLVLPIGILLVAFGLLAYAARDTFWPVRQVEVVRVVARSGQHPSDHSIDPDTPSTVVVQASGWIEPDPYPIYVTALSDGVIEKLLVLEGDKVQAGQVVAEMVDDDARLAVTRAEAELARHNALLVAARTNWNNPVNLERAVAVNEALYAKAQAELGQLDATVAQQSAKHEELRAIHDRLSRLGPQAVASLEIEQTQYQLEAQKALVESTEKQRFVLESQSQRFKAELKAAEADLQLRVAQRQALGEAEAAVQNARGSLDEANLWLARTKIVSPVSGVVINRMVAPGSKVMFGMDSPHSAHVVHLYDPGNLQVRVDVPLVDAAGVGVGQQARVIVDVLPDTTFNGHVTRLVHQADIGKNTLQVKVAIDNPSPLLKPDMLARVKFLGVNSHSASDGDSDSSFLVFAPMHAIQGSGRQASVWLVTANDSTAHRQAVRLGSPRDGGWVAVIAGLQPGDVLIVNPVEDLQEGQRVRIATKYP